MTVKELKETLEQFDENLVVAIPNMNWTPFNKDFHSVVATKVAQGVNELDGFVFIDSCREDKE